MAKHNLSAVHIASLEADRLALLALHDALPALKAAKQVAHNAVEAAEGEIAGLLDKLAHSVFQGLDVNEPAVKMQATEAQAAAASPKKTAIAAAISTTKSKLPNLK